MSSPSVLMVFFQYSFNGSPTLMTSSPLVQSSLPTPSLPCSRTDFTLLLVPCLVSLPYLFLPSLPFQHSPTLSSLHRSLFLLTTLFSPLSSLPCFRSLGPAASEMGLFPWGHKLYFHVDSFHTRLAKCVFPL